MNIHEYQAKMILRQYGINIPDFAVVTKLNEVKEIINELDLYQAVVKVQVHAGGRGKAGGVKLARNREEILSFSKQLLGMKIVNNQTGPEGVVSHQILLSPLIEVKREFYIGAVIDRKRSQALLIVSPAGGMDIEEIAHTAPDKILTLPISPTGDLKSYHLLQIANFMNWSEYQAEQGKAIVKSIAKAFIDTDSSLLEVNPLVETTNGDLIVLDAKLSVDENALYRQPQIASFYDPTQISTNEALAREHGLSYIALEGEIGCMVNGAGLAMATMDIIKLYGGTPANFLDVGGGASQDKVAEGFKIILSDPKVRAILVNIFGGIMNCVTLAAGIIAAAGELKVSIPLIVRMEGTNVEQGKKMLADSGLDITIANTFSDAAQKAVAASRA